MENNVISNLCKLLSNPLKREMLLRVYTSREGMNVGIIADEMYCRGLELSGVSQYLRQIERFGIIRRERSGRYVNYIPNPQNVPDDVRVVVDALATLFKKGEDIAYDKIFGALTNPFRVRVVDMLAKCGSMHALDICSATEHISRYLKRDLQPAVDAGLIYPDDAETALAVYHFVRPTDSFVRLLVSLCH